MDWLAIELTNGLTKLVSLGLQWTPASDVIEVTVGTWLEAVTVGRVWDKTRDTPRIRAAFVTLESTREAWPAPKHFLDALPRVEQRAMGYEVKPLSPAEADARLAALRAELDTPIPVEPKPSLPEREGPPLGEVEQQLRQHYADRKAAAAGPDA